MEGHVCPRFKTVVQHVYLGPEIETKLRMMVPDLTSQFVYRVICFALSGTCIVDLRCTTENQEGCTHQAKFACSINANFLTRLMTKSVMSQRKVVFHDDPS